LHERQFHFEWDEIKAAANMRKHGVSFDLASTIFYDSFLLTGADLKHGNTEERWFSVGCARNGVILFVAYLWAEMESTITKVRLISARRATQTEIAEYKEGI
jgi:uncharacterized DUF497 family protein